MKKGKPSSGNDDIHVRTRNQPGSYLNKQFDLSTTPDALRALPTAFSSPPLSPGLQQSVHDLLGPSARPTLIQSLSLKYLFFAEPSDAYRRFLLASETGSGKSLAYLLPMLHSLKMTEHLRSTRSGPRALVLTPTHELSRQLASFSKALVHHSRLRVQTSSRPNVAKVRMSAAEMANVFDGDNAEGEFELYPGPRTSHALDVLVGTPARVLRMARGRGSDKELAENDQVQRRKSLVGRPEISLSEIEWVVVDEADILFDADFVDQTLSLLSDIAAARGKPVPAVNCDNESRSNAPVLLDYPFNFILTSATIPAALAAHLDSHHPEMARLVSPRLHRLPTHLAVEFAPYKSGNRNAEVLAKLKAIWRDDALAGRDNARIIIFANTRARAGEMGTYLSESRVENIVVTGQSHRQAGRGGRLLGSSKHLAGFLRPVPGEKILAHSQSSGGGGEEEVVVRGERESPRVLLSTSLLARGLDFDPSVSHVFVLDPPKNMADFLHRAGRTARAGRSGKVILFGRAAGRGAGKLQEMRRLLAKC
ncbi:P-loop containing nucleoside triphosphate hydrolase protein [Russula earlei]|uniref:P-loop containing nucleoside triphosphate hydrolase protein n=1 Tax=Russula earlei TaxID=71964 RepID=A0ACC0U3E8_9AGAM|nr:P-loop containing nucleoside triphosphate hydrolase protein [Russula earlei]